MAGLATSLSLLGACGGSAGNGTASVSPSATTGTGPAPASSPATSATSAPASTPAASSPASTPAASSPASSGSLPDYTPSTVVSRAMGHVQLTTPDSVRQVTAFYD
ncbi:MAG TPA: hypothetical protein VF834_18525, partial [Streptosporangiaceae bacterium]